MVHGGGRDRGEARAARHHGPLDPRLGHAHGDNRETNVVDRFGFAHAVGNLGILGASVMGTNGAHHAHGEGPGLAHGGASGQGIGGQLRSDAAGEADATAASHMKPTTA